MITPKNSQSPTKTFSASSKYSKKRKRRSSTSSTKRTYKRTRFRNWNYRKRARKLAKYRSNKVINVANDKEGLSKSYHKQKVTRSQQRAINKRFKNGYSPFVRNTTDHLQLTSKIEVNKCKWIWRCSGLLSDIITDFKAFPRDLGDPGNTNATGQYYLESPEQTIYINQYKYIYDIMNPTNYDMDLIIYDIVYKQDTLDNHCNNAYWENNGTGGSSNCLADASAYNDPSNIYQNPIGLINSGCHKVGTTTTIVSDPTNLTFDSININPTDSYPFNIYCKIIKKHRYRLQPGATMTHIFTHKPKSLFNRGYLYKYNVDINDGDFTNDFRAIKDITSGCLFKFYGQLLNSGEDSEKSQVLSASGKLVIKERIEAKWYAMTPKYTYTWNTENNWDGTVSGGTSKLDNLEVVNNDSVKPVKEVNMDATDNLDTATTST